MERSLRNAALMYLLLHFLMKIIFNCSC